jgi:hypothetical protein
MSERRQLSLNFFIYPDGHHEAAWRHRALPARRGRKANPLADLGHDPKIAAADAIEATRDCSAERASMSGLADVSRCGDLVWRTGCCLEIRLRNEPYGTAAVGGKAVIRPEVPGRRYLS